MNDNIEDFDSNLLKIDKKSFKNINIYYIGYITMKDSDYIKIKIVNPLYLIVSDIDGYPKEINGNKYLILDSAQLRSTNKNKEVLKNTLNYGMELKMGLRQ